MSIDIASPESVGMSSKRLDRIGPVMEAYVSERGVVGISTLISRRGQVVHADQFGDRDREAGLPVTPDTIFRIYSMTKPIVSTALMLLHEEAKFQLENPVANFLPAFGSVRVLTDGGTLVDPVRPIEIRDLLTHTSGLTYDFMVDTAVAQMYRDAKISHDATRTLAEMIDELAMLPLAFHPGARWHYSIGIDVAARLIEVISGLPLGRFLRERLFAPLGMVDTGFGVAADDLGRLAAMYGLPDLVGDNYSAVQLVEAALGGFNERIDVSATYPTGTPEVFNRGGLGLFSTIGDYLRFARMLANGGELDGQRVVGRKTLELMHANHVADALLPYELLGVVNHGMGFGLGSRVMLDPARTGGAGSVGEFGWAGAAKTYFWVDPVEELIGVFMSQYMTGVLQPDRDLRSLAYQAIVD